MHLTIFKLKSGKIISDYIKSVDLKNKRVLLWKKNIWIKFSDLESAITEKDRVSIIQPNIDYNELPRWKQL